MNPAAAPWTEVGLTAAEYRLITERLGREPNHVELGMFGLMWSEHCSYKTSKAHLKLLPQSGKRIVVGPGENAGVADLGDGFVVVWKIESHNHPSAIEPYQGAATGVGGILRDIFTMGARPIACLDSLRFGPPDDARVRYLVGGVVAGIAGYGNTTGVPTVGGEMAFDECYRDNCLVNVMCVGLLAGDRLIRGRAEGPGNPVLLVGNRTGRDGIHGASLLASREFDEKAEELRPAVQVADPFVEKLLIEACLELAKWDGLVGINDLGAAGLTSAASEMASRAGTGLDLDLALVPRREPGMNPYEVMLSESQERMLVVVEAGREREALALFEKWGLVAAVIGRVTDDGVLRLRDSSLRTSGSRDRATPGGDGVVVAEVPARLLAHDAPAYERPMAEPAYLAEARKLDLGRLPSPTLEGLTGPSDPDAVHPAAILCRLLASPNIACKEWVWRQYDHMVRTNTVVLPGSDAAVLRLKREEGESAGGGATKQGLPGGQGTGAPVRGIALSTDGNGRYAYLDPYLGGAQAVAEAARNVVCAGAEPVGLTNCLNFASPEDPGVMWQFRRCVEGLAEACRVLETPVTGGNVSFYNETMGRAIFPTPVVGMLGLLEDIEHRTTAGFKRAGDAVLLAGKTREELGGTEYLKLVTGEVRGLPPTLDLGREKALQSFVLAAIRAGLVRSAHDCSEGGLAVALAECAFLAEPGAAGVEADVSAGVAAPAEGTAGVGADVLAASPIRLDAALFGESQSRVVLSCGPAALPALTDLAAGHGVPLARLGAVRDGRFTLRFGRTTVCDERTVELETIWREALPRALHG
jgi:phosphoribosylformylglycinamidine (FGAM) synthase-like enzyme